MKYIKQHEEIDCGAACLSMIASHYGLFYSLSKYREITKTNKNGTNLHGLVDGASKIGLKGTALSGTPIDLKKGIENGEIHFPFIAHTLTAQANQHFVVVSGFKNGKYIIGDPQKGKIKLSEEDL